VIRGALLALPILVALTASGKAADGLIHVQRYSMGTMFDLFVVPTPQVDAQRAIDDAWSEIERVDRVLSTFKAESDVSRVNRTHPTEFVSVDPLMVDVASRSIAFWRDSGGTFDITIAPLLRIWKKAYAAGRPPSPDAIEAARACVGSEKIETAPPDRIRVLSPCVELDFGGIGKGYAVDRAIEVLRARGITKALVNAGGSSIGAMGAPPGEAGWPVQLAAPVSGRRVLLLRDASMSTSQQRPHEFASSPKTFGEILDPRSGTPIDGSTAVTVVTDNGAAAEALTKALLMVPPSEASDRLARFPPFAALWITEHGKLTAAFNTSRLELSD
jgi:thiamine biosynthesis lipoprotein